jgi:hypothetical protein
VLLLSAVVRGAAGAALAGLELVEEAVEVVAVEDQAAALSHRDQARAPVLVEGAALDADVLQRFVVGESALHARDPGRWPMWKPPQNAQR